MTKPNLTLLEKEASEMGLLLRIQVRRPLNIWSFKLVVGEITSNTKIQLLGEMKGWAYQNTKGLQLDTMKVGKNANSKICLLYTSPSPRDLSTSRMPSSA